MTRLDSSAPLPVIDVALLPGAAAGAAAAVQAPVTAEALAVTGQIQAACRERGFFYVTGHGVPAALVEELAGASAEFFALPVEDKLEIAMGWQLRVAVRGRCRRP